MIEHILRSNRKNSIQKIYLKWEENNCMDTSNLKLR